MFVSKEMMTEVWKSRSRYQLALEEKKKNQTKKEKWSLEKRHLATELKQVQAQKVTEKRTTAETGALDAKIFGIKEKIGQW